MRWTACLFAAALALPQDDPDLDALKRAADQGMFARDDGDAWKAFAKACAKAKDRLEREKDPAARIFLAAADPNALNTVWTPRDPLHRAWLAWVLRHSDRRKWIDELKKWMTDADSRAGFSAARALERLLDENELRKLADWAGGRAGGLRRAEDIDRASPLAYFVCARRDWRLWHLVPQASGERVVFFTALMPEEPLHQILGMGMAVARQQMLAKVLDAAAKAERLSAHGAALLPDAAERLGGLAAVLDAAAAGTGDVRRRAQALAEERAKGPGFWLATWIALLERPGLDEPVARWAHAMIEKLTGRSFDFTTRGDTAKEWRAHVAKNCDALIGKHVNQAIGRGVAWLKSIQDAKTGRWGQVGAGGEGTTGLCLFTLLHAGVPLDDPAVKRGFQSLAATPPAHIVYQEGAVAMACAQYVMLAPAARGKDVFNPAAVAARLKDAVAMLVAMQKSGGTWARGYGGRDHSNVQLAMLGLAQAQAAGVAVKPHTWDRARAFLTSTQNGDGGWGYNRAEVPESYGSMTAASAFGILLSMRATKSKDFDAGLADGWAGAAKRAFAWFDKNLSIENGHHPWGAAAGATTDKPSRIPDWKRGSVYYWLYSLARLCLLAKTERISGRPWYTDGAFLILGRQQASGQWTDGSFATADTCFAILFLRRVKIDAEPVPSVDERFKKK